MQVMYPLPRLNNNNRRKPQYLLLLLLDVIVLIIYNLLMNCVFLMHIINLLTWLKMHEQLHLCNKNGGEGVNEPFEGRKDL